IQFGNVVVECLTHDLAFVADDHSDTTNSKRATGSRQTGEVATMYAGRDPLGGHLIALHQTVRYGDLSVGSSSRYQVFTRHNCGTANEGMWLHTSFDDCVLGVVVV